MTKHCSAVVWVSNFWNGHHGDAFFDDHIRLPWQVAGFRVTAPSDRWDFFAIGIQTWNHSAIRRDFHLDAFDVFVAAPEGEVENRHLGTTSTEEFITTIDRWVFTHQAGAVKEWVAGAIRIITSDAPCESIATGGASPQTVALTVVGSCDVDRVGHNRTIDGVTEVGITAVDVSSDDWNWCTGCTAEQHGWLSIDSPVAPVFTGLEPAVIGDV